MRLDQVATAASGCGAAWRSLPHPQLYALSRLQHARQGFEGEIKGTDELADGLSFHQVGRRFVEAVHRPRPGGKCAGSHLPKVVPQLTDEIARRQGS